MMLGTSCFAGFMVLFTVKVFFCLMIDSFLG